MSVNSVPVYKSASELHLAANYACPLCHSQSASDSVDGGWVLCPMVNNQAIGLGCCLDYQDVARYDDFEKHLYYDLFEEAERVSQKSIAELRQICLRHQKQILEKELSQSKDEHTTNAQKALLNHIAKHLEDE